MIDIIIVTYNAKDKLRRCLKSVEKYTKNVDYLLTIVNNNSNDGTFQFLEKYQKQRTMQVVNADKNLGFCGGVNLALKNTYNRFICLLDDDAEVTRGWLTGLYSQIRNKPKVGMVGAKIVYLNKRLFCADYRIKTLQPVGCNEIDKGQRDYIKECDGLAGTCWLMRRELLNKVGYFDERFFPCQDEDIDYCIRTRLAGYKIIYNGKIKIIHHHLFRDGGRKQNASNRQKFLKKWKNLLCKFPLKYSHPVDKYMACGIDHLNVNKFKQALAQFKKVGLIDKRFAEYLYVGMAYEGIGQYREAKEQYRKAIILNPSNLSAYYRLALLYKKTGSTKEAKKTAAKMFEAATSKKIWI